MNNYNLQNSKTTWKLTRYLSILHGMFPLDPTIHLALSKCYSLEGGSDNLLLAEKYLNLAEREISDKKYWTNLFDLSQKFDQHQIINPTLSKS